MYVFPGSCNVGQQHTTCQLVIHRVVCCYPQSADGSNWVVELTITWRESGSDTYARSAGAISDRKILGFNPINADQLWRSLAKGNISCIASRLLPE